MRRKAGQRVYFDAGARSATKLVRGRTDALWARLNLSAAGCAARKHGECGDRKNCTHVISPFRSSGRKNRNCRGNFAILPLSRPPPGNLLWIRSEEHTSELQSLMRISYAVFCLKKNICNNV